MGRTRVAVDSRSCRMFGNLNWRLDRRRLTGGPLAKSDRRSFERFKHLLFHTVASPKLKLFSTFIVLIDNTAVRP